MKKKGIRDQMVIATKFTTCFRHGYGDSEITINAAGNGTKSLHLSLEASLKKLQTTYIDLVRIATTASLNGIDRVTAICALVGLHMFNSRTHAESQHHGTTRQGMFSSRSSSSGLTNQRCYT
jgi:hypothetical protein